ncbi:tyrosinase, putative, partial [Rhizoctonia solani AG-3 Rhs1AP]
MKFLASLSFLALHTLFDLVSATNSTQTCTSIEVRKEWRNLTAVERKAWIEAVNCLNTRPRSGKLNPPLNTVVDYSEIYDQIAPVTENSTYYDDFVYAHMDLNRKKANPPRSHRLT